VPRYLLPPSHPLHIPPHIARGGVKKRDALARVEGAPPKRPPSQVAWDLQHRLGVNVIEPETGAAEVSPGGEESA